MAALTQARPSLKCSPPPKTPPTPATSRRCGNLRCRARTGAGEYRSPRWFSRCYLKAGDVERARTIAEMIPEPNRKHPSAVGIFASLDLLSHTSEPDAKLELRDPRHRHAHRLGRAL